MLYLAGVIFLKNCCVTNNFKKYFLVELVDCKQLQDEYNAGYEIGT